MLYLAYFNINPDMDFHYERYKGIEDDYALFTDQETARIAVLEHIKLAIDTLDSNKSLDWIQDWKDWLWRNYEYVKEWDFDERPKLYVEDEWGNQTLKYVIQEVKFFIEWGHENET